MNKSIKITIIIIGALTIAASIYSFAKGCNNEVAYFALFIGIALIGTAIFSKKIENK